MIASSMASSSHDNATRKYTSNRDSGAYAINFMENESGSSESKDDVPFMDFSFKCGSGSNQLGSSMGARR